MVNNESIKITINASEIINRLKNRQDRQNFCQEINWYCPQEPGYDSTYFLKVIMGEKKYLPINFNIGYKLRYFKKGITLNKKYIISKMMGNPTYALYTPDNTNIEKLSREFLLTLVAYIDPELYKNFYSIYKQQTMERKFNKWSNYTIDIKSDILQKIKQFVPIELDQGRNSGFQLTKNHVNNYTFKEGRNMTMRINPIPKEVLKKNLEVKKIISNNPNQSNNIKCGNRGEDKDIEMKLDTQK